jgi:hypothetical protein
MSSTDEQQLCKNCGNYFLENFCNRCGQREAHRITVPHVLHDMVHVFLHADKGVFPFIGRLIKQPGVLAREYVDGKRKVFNPYQFLIFCVGFVLFLMTQSHFYEMLEGENAARTSKLPTYFQKAMADFNWVVKKYANVITFLHLPVIAFFGWLFFKKRQHNYAEHFTITVFAVSLAYIINALALVCYLVFSINSVGIVTISVLLLILSLIVTYKQFYKLKLWTAIWKGILMYGAAYLVQLLIMGIGLLLYILLLKTKH